MKDRIGASSKLAKRRVHSKDGFGAVFDLGKAFVQFYDINGHQMQVLKDADPE